MPKVIFILHRREGVSREECSERWSSERHTSLVGALPGRPGKGPELAGNGVAVEDSKSFLDMEKTSIIIVEEKAIPS